mgnify:CR=1 FL=1
MRKLWMIPFLLVVGLMLLATQAIASDPIDVAQSDGLTVNRHVVGTAVTDREPEGVADSFSYEEDELICFVEFANSGEPTDATIVWYVEGKHLYSKDVTVKTSGRYRTWAAANPNARRRGTWKCDVQDADGKVLSSVQFTID